METNAKLPMDKGAGRGKFVSAAACLEPAIIAHDGVFASRQRVSTQAQLGSEVNGLGDEAAVLIASRAFQPTAAAHPARLQSAATTPPVGGEGW